METQTARQQKTCGDCFHSPDEFWRRNGMESWMCWDSDQDGDVGVSLTCPACSKWRPRVKPREKSAPDEQ